MRGGPGELAEDLAGLGSVTTADVAQDGDWCVVEGPVTDPEAQILPD